MCCFWRSGQSWLFGGPNHGQVPVIAQHGPEEVAVCEAEKIGLIEDRFEHMGLSKKELYQCANVYWYSPQWGTWWYTMGFWDNYHVFRQTHRWILDYFGIKPHDLPPLDSGTTWLNHSWHHMCPERGCEVSLLEIFVSKVRALNMFHHFPVPWDITWHFAEDFQMYYHIIIILLSY